MTKQQTRTDHEAARSGPPPARRDDAARSERRGGPVTDSASPRAATSSAAHPFAALEALRGTLPTGPAPAAPASAAAEARPRGPARAVVRIERKGRGGKEVTIVDKLGLPLAELTAWCKDLKQALGCGGSVDGEVIVLQGDLRSRIPAVLNARGVSKVTVG